MFYLIIDSSPKLDYTLRCKVRNWTGNGGTNGKYSKTIRTN